MIAIPSTAMTVETTPCEVSESFSSLDAIPISQVPSIAEETPVEESLWLTSTLLPLTASYFSASTCITGVTEEEPATEEKEEEKEETAANPFDKAEESEEKPASEEEESEEEKKEGKMRFGFNSLVKNASKSLAKLAKSMEEEDENPEFVCMICGKKLSSEKMQNHTKHCKVPKGFKGSQFMVLESDEMRMKKAEEEEKPVEEEKKEEVIEEKEEEKAPVEEQKEETVSEAPTEIAEEKETNPKSE